MLLYPRMDSRAFHIAIHGRAGLLRLFKRLRSDDTSLVEEY